MRLGSAIQIILIIIGIIIAVIVGVKLSGYGNCCWLNEVNVEIPPR